MRIERRKRESFTMDLEITGITEPVA